MDMSDSRRIEAPREVVWAALNDPDVLKQAIPGCDEIERLSENELQAKVTLKIGPVKAAFTGRVTLSNIDPPNGYTITGEGQGGVAGHARGGADVRLEPDGEATILHYTARAEVGGKIAQLGARLIDSTARKLAGDFFQAFGEILVPPDVAGEAEAGGQETGGEDKPRGKWWKFGKA
ncbi:MAG: carbon monoxide dehydrogenase subunit G [Hyphomicrobiales bacterium]|uniref:SRPBCC family protein n=1 Tax=Rhabdaerophilum calidifontis TaxID=2604328 RepID=UPI0012390C26|nr:carbon monoxide dehydrogenase subunit G [Rhabdaerophilum calidifontis]MCA1953027.1 carbon monoxide dehydrogenase subunit G [Hyphomicrobiales bacterium]MCA1999680.1 carbon monoxide dehydrogenase subunit G [Hyphomicrobiales bacterium]